LNHESRSRHPRATASTTTTSIPPTPAVGRLATLGAFLVFWRWTLLGTMAVVAAVLIGVTR
jgi:hypothetical protein